MTWTAANYDSTSDSDYPIMKCALRRRRTAKKNRYRQQKRDCRKKIYSQNPGQILNVNTHRRNPRREVATANFKRYQASSAATASR
jgi:hypothetical protein